MALLFPWATKEYLLWNMTIGQIVMYHNKAVELRSGAAPGLVNKSAKELRELSRKILGDVAAAEASAKRQAELEAKYGRING